MGVLTLEGVVEEGKIRLTAGIRLPEQTKVYVVVPGTEVIGQARIVSPRLVHREDVQDFCLEVVEAPPDADL